MVTGLTTTGYWEGLAASATGKNGDDARSSGGVVGSEGVPVAETGDQLAVQAGMAGEHIVAQHSLCRVPAQHMLCTIHTNTDPREGSSRHPGTTGEGVGGRRIGVDDFGILPVADDAVAGGAGMRGERHGVWRRLATVVARGKRRSGRVVGGPGGTHLVLQIQRDGSRDANAGGHDTGDALAVRATGATDIRHVPGEGHAGPQQGGDQCRGQRQRQEAGEPSAGRPRSAVAHHSKRKAMPSSVSILIVPLALQGGHSYPASWYVYLVTTRCITTGSTPVPFVMPRLPRMKASFRCR